MSEISFKVNEWAWIIDDRGQQISVLVRDIEELGDGYSVTFENMQTGDRYYRRYRTGVENEDTND
jgi:arginyl-tRNA synthetase